MKYDITKDDTKVMEDGDIIELYWSRNESAIEQTDKKYGKYLYTIAYNIVHDNMDSEECLSDTYLTTWNKIPPTRPKLLKVFLSKLTRDAAVDKYRKMSADKRVSSELTVSLDELDDCLYFSESAEDDFIVRQVSSVLNNYLRSLNKRKICVFICRYYYADSIQSIAGMFGISERTILRDLASIRSGLKAKLEEMGYRYEQV